MAQTDDDKRASQAAKEVASSFANVTKVIGRFIPGFDKLGEEISGMTTAYAQLSNTGNAFNNDMIGMRVAAAQARMSLEEYSKVVSDNSKSFTGLGGSVSQGTKVFGEFSKAFFESGLTENLRQMGYTSKDLNEILATQIGFQKSSTDNTVEGQMRTAKAATELAEELDLIAKLTGVSRREQEEKLKKAAADGQVESKFRLILAQQGVEAEKEARAAYGKQLAQAQAMGQEQLFKEYFATGTATSKEAQMQLALFGDASMKTAESAQQLSNNQIELSKETMKAAQIANMKNQSDTTLLTIGATGVGSAAKAVIKNVEINDAAYQGMKKFMQGTEDVVGAMQKQYDAILKEQKARDTFTETIITANNRLQDVRAGVVGAVGAGIKKSGEDGTLKSVNKLVMAAPGSVSKDASNEQLAEKYKTELGKMNLAYKAQQMATEGVVGDFFKGLDKLGKVTIDGLTNAVVKGAEVINKISDKMDANRQQAGGATQPKTEAPKREGGSIEEAGKLFEDWGKGTLVELHGMESVIKPDQMMNFAKGMGQQGATTAFNNMKGLLAGQDKGTSKGIDLAKLSDIKTSVGKVEVINWPKDLISKVEIKTPPATGAAQKPADTKPADTKPADTKPADTKPAEKPAESQSRAEKAAKAAEEVTIKSGDTLSSLAKKYNTSVAELMKANPAVKDANKISAGVKLTIPGPEKKVTGNEDTAKKALTEVEQAQIKQAEQETKFRQIGLEKGEQAEKQARENYAKEQAQQAALKKWREDELKIQITGIREGAEAAQKVRDSIAKQADVNTIKTSETKVTVNGKNVDPNSPEGQAAIKQMDAVKASLENGMSSMLNLTKNGFGDLAKTNITELKNAQSKISETKVTINGKDIDPNSKEGQSVVKEMEESKNRLEKMMSSMMSGVVEKRTEPRERKQEFKLSEIPNFDNFIAKLQGKVSPTFESKNTETKLTVNGKNVDPDSREGKEALAQLDEAKSRMFGLFGNIKTNFEDVEKVSKDSNAELKNMFTDMIPITEMQSQQSEFKSKFTDEQKKFIEDYQGMSKDNQEFMTSALQRQQGIDAETIEKHNGIVADLQKKKNERELTEEEEAKLADSEMISARIKEEHAQRQQQLDMIKNMDTVASDLELERLDQQARKELDLMKGFDEEKIKRSELTNELLTQQFLEANQEMIGSVGGLNDAALEARETFMKEINEMFDMPERDEFSEDEYGEGGEVINESVQNLVDQISGLKEFEQDEYGEGGEVINESIQNLVDQISGLKEFEQDEYGEGGESIGEDDLGDDYSGSDLLDDFKKQVPDIMQYADDMRAGEEINPIATGTDSMAEDAAFGAGSGDASVAGIDFATSNLSSPNTGQINLRDFSPALDELTKTLPQAKPLEKNGPKTESKFSSIDMGSFTLGPDGMPIPTARAQGQAAANSVKQEKDDKKVEDKKATQASVRAVDNKIDKDKDGKKEGEPEKKTTKTLDDVVKALETLNSSVGKLTTKVEDSAKQQVQATKTLNGNLYNK